MNPSDETIDLDEGQRKRAFEMTLAAWTEDHGRAGGDKEPDAPGGEQIRQVRDRTRGLLLIYPLAASEDVKSSKPVIGFAFSFPDSDNAVKVEYTVNNTYWKLEYADA